MFRNFKIRHPPLEKEVGEFDKSMRKVEGCIINSRIQEDILKKDGADIRRMFASIARFYDLLNRLLSLRFDQGWRRFAVNVSHLPPNAKILDVCSGTADLAIAYSGAIKGDGRVIGSDFCHEMLRLGNRKINKLGLKNKICLTEADTLCLPFKDNQFHISAVAFGIRNLADLERGIMEMVRVIAPGGKIVILEFSQPIDPFFRHIYYLYFTKILPILGNIISQSRDNAYTYLPASVLSFPDRYILKTLLERCGLSDVKIYSRTFGIVTIHVGTKR